MIDARLRRILQQALDDMRRDPATSPAESESIYQVLSAEDLLQRVGSRALDVVQDHGNFSDLELPAARPFHPIRALLLEHRSMMIGVCGRVVKGKA